MIRSVNFLDVSFINECYELTPIEESNRNLSLTRKQAPRNLAGEKKVLCC